MFGSGGTRDLHNGHDATFGNYVTKVEALKSRREIRGIFVVARSSVASVRQGLHSSRNAGKTSTDLRENQEGESLVPLVFVVFSQH